ncbi:MAG: hypothetical protein ACNA8W_17650, partial [Bradymonadaceae bacterium]
QIVAGVGLETSRRGGPSAGLGLEPDVYEGILICLGTRIQSAEELIEARFEVAQKVEAMARALE